MNFSTDPTIYAVPPPKSHKEVDIPTWTTMSQTKTEPNLYPDIYHHPEPCHHFLTGACRKRSICKFGHLTEDCPRHRPDLPPAESCNQENCVLRHAKLCSHHAKGRCLFGKRCALFHPAPPPDGFPILSIINDLQSQLKELQSENINLQKKVEYLRMESKKPPDIVGREHPGHGRDPAGH